MRTFVEIGFALAATFVVIGQTAAQPAPLPFAPTAPDAIGAPNPLPSGGTSKPARLDQGRVLLLDNDRILEGEIERIGNRFRIRRSVGELWIPCDRARRLCRDLDEAFLLMQSQTNLRDPDECLRLARWCHANGLKERALFEARIALDMRPDHPETVQLVQVLQRLSIGTPTPSAPTAPKTASTTPPTPAAPPTTVAAAPALDVSDDVFIAFSSRVQPILINACYSCHHAGKSTSFVLSRPSEGNYRTSAQRNLAAVLEHVNVEKTILSPLLIKAVVAHGGATQAPLHGRQSIPFQTMQGWVEQLVAMNPHLVEIRRASASTAGSGQPAYGASTSAKHDYGEEARPASETRPASFSSDPSPSRPRSPNPPPLQTPALLPASPSAMPPAMPPFGRMPSMPTTPSAPASPGVSAAPMPRDPFDADEFNRQNDPKK
jgi:hypothetical protein